MTKIKWSQDRETITVGTPNGSTVSKPLVDYPDDDDEDIMDTKPEDAQTDPVDEVPQTPPPERLAEKRRREEEDEDELVKLTAGPKRRSSTSSNAGAGSILRKKSLSASPVDKNTAVPGVTSAPKRIAINIGPTAKMEEGDDSNEKENRDRDDAGQGGDDE
jgi:protein phosphatase-4 regulatory subunit 3